MNIQFRMVRDTSNKYYYINFFKNNKTYCCFDKEIASLIDIPYKDYEKLAVSYGAELYNYYNTSVIYFYSHVEAKEFVNYLNDKYLVMIALSGKV